MTAFPFARSVARLGRVAGQRGIAALATLALGACIIPDASVQIQLSRTNPGAVRLVQPVPISAEAYAACDAVSEACPLVDRTLPFGLISNEGRPFCVCAANERDLNALAEFHIFVEDPDLADDERTPLDSILGALLLYPAADQTPTALDVPPVAYENYLPTNQPARRVQGSVYDDAIERPSPNVKQWTLGAESSVDLCNNNNGAPLSPGTYTLQVVVTDRPWFIPVADAPDSEWLYDPWKVDGLFQRENVDPSPGIPDLPGEATYDTESYVFRCYDASTSDQPCNCRSVSAP